MRGACPYHYHRGWTLYLLGRYDEAIETLTAGLKSQPDYAHALFRRGVSYEKKGDRAKAEADLRAAAKSNRRFWTDEMKIAFERFDIR